MPSLFVGIDHIGIAVKDLKSAETTYQDTLGFPILRSEELPERGLEVLFVDAGNSTLELIGATRPDSEISAFLEKRGEGIHHICLEVKNIEAAVSSMKERGAKFAGEKIEEGAHNTRVAFLHPKGSHGVLIELVEKPQE